MFKSIVEAVSAHAVHMPEKLCAADLEGAYSYRWVWEKILLCAKHFKENGLQNGDKVVVECTQNVSFLVCALACQLSGIIFVPVEFKAPCKKISTIMNEVKAKLFVYGTAESYGCSQMDMLSVQREREGEKMPSYEFPRGEDIAEILYTTGTTGIPKGIMLSNRNNVAVAENIICGTEMKENNVELVPLPLSHSHGLRTCYANLLNGSSVVLVNGIINLKNFFDLMDRYKVTAIDLSPSASKMLLKMASEHLCNYRSKIDYIEIGTETLDEEVKSGLCHVFPESRLYNFYGSTESGRTCVYDFNAVKGRNCCIGFPAKNATFIVTDDERSPMQSGPSEMGLLAIAGDMNMAGYYNDKKLTDETIKNGYIYTNDIGYIDESGEVYLFGRKGNVINYKGIKIAPEEIETVAMDYKGIVDCACVPQTDEIGGEVPKLFITTAQEWTLEKHDFMDFLASRLGSSRMPKIIEIVDQIPRAPNGKILRSSLISRQRKENTR